MSADDPVDTDDTTPVIEDADINADSIRVSSVLGLNEQICINILKPDSGEYAVSYRETGTENFISVDKELVLDDGDMLKCYILGLKKGVYDVRIETGSGEGLSRMTVHGIDVERQDRSGYAHFGREEGIGGYNNDGTVKDGAKILYVSNETKNTVTMEISGTTYTGLAAILEANQHMEEPLIVRVLDTIVTNQWNSKEGSPSPEDYTSDYYSIGEAFSGEYGENLIGLPAPIFAEQIYEYVTTADGITLLSVMDGETIYERALNTILIENTKDITIEGVGENAGFCQIGINFLYSDSIEIKNLTFSDYPADGLSLQAYQSQGDTIVHGWYWIHNNTFNVGCQTWNGWGGPQDSDGDEAVSIADVRNVTLSYNEFYQTGKSMIFGGWEYDACMNFSLHHNHYREAEQRLPLSRNSNIHSYNNYFDNCWRGLSPRTSSYVFSEVNYFENVDSPFYGDSGTETFGAVKSWNEIYYECGDIEFSEVVIASDREEYVENTCMPEEGTDCSKFDIDPTLFYYDAENKCSDVEFMLDAKDIPELIPKYAGAGALARIDDPDTAE